jgi:hypothetical protein
MIDIETLKIFLKKKGIYLLEDLEQVKKVVADKFPGLSNTEIDSICERLTQHCFGRKGASR